MDLVPLRRGIELCYELSGDRGAPVLALVNGLGSSMATWDERFVAMFLERGLAVLRFDTRDSGRSTILSDSPRFDLDAASRGDRAVVRYVLDDLADDTAALVGELGLAPVHLLGVSLGGMIAQMTAARHPDAVQSLCSVMSTTGARGVGGSTPQAAALLRRRPASGREQYIEQECENGRILGGGDPRYDDVAWRRERFARLFDHGVVPEGTGRLLMAIVASGDRTQVLGSIEAPTLVVHGDRDPLIDVSGGRATADAIPGARLVVVPGLGHELPPALWPELVEAVIGHVRSAEAAPRGAAR